ncbi:phosphate/phosphite/phosphonate ABC transporter substrate-binding protein [Vibrio sagamiensis]|uniref:Phosphate ABC transporter substrate-binding protein n=1 Tax=Vibrio sagamiensis NBRC 104589 TaxID=1219064 RepID=A0A511QD64_9VIBR|nr:phosphate/phosphite/phosphonate ABC transporter substrate-binding protein [Vibrio sagamiensis]PNQ68875.1 phosphate ABC transporter substrate-binding protein [Vibrio agarivorans]GEM75241.1 phosphate ABC transporter substrate-binding protein [Vibrio sagamiensis NBRC 104589]
MLNQAHLTKKSVILRRSFLFFGLFAISFTPIVLSKTPLTFGVVPQQSAAKLAEQWQPLLDAWGELANVEFKFATARDIPTFEQRLADGQYDVAYMNPYHFTLVNKTPGYSAVAHAKDKKIKGILVTRADWSGTVADLADETIAFPAPRAFAASIINQSELAQKNIPITAKYVGSHDSVYLNVAKGLYPAGGGVMRTFKSLPEKTQQQLKILYTTSSYTPHAIAVSHNVPIEAQQALRQTIGALNSNQQAQQSFKQLNIKGLQKADDRDWDDIVQLNLSL